VPLEQSCALLNAANLSSPIVSFTSSACLCSVRTPWPESRNCIVHDWAWWGSLQRLACPVRKLKKSFTARRMGKRCVLITGCSSGEWLQCYAHSSPVRRSTSRPPIDLPWLHRHRESAVLCSTQQNRPEGEEALPGLCHSEEAWLLSLLMTAPPIPNLSNTTCSNASPKLKCDRYHRIESLIQLAEDGISTVSLDVCSQASISACMAEVTKQTGAIDILINNAVMGTQHGSKHRDHGSCTPIQ
jgi:hypothetical protein